MAETFGRPKSCINVNLNKIQNTVNEFQIFLSDEQWWGFLTRKKSELHRINTFIKPYLQHRTGQK